MLYRMPPRLRMFVETVVWTAAAYLATVGVLAMMQGQADGPEWWLVLAWLVGAGLGSLIRKVPFHILATDRSQTANGKIR